jgi:Zn-finger nucleic acid-binding protein
MEKKNKPYEHNDDMCYFKSVHLRLNLDNIVLLNDCPKCDGMNKKCGGYMGLGYLNKIMDRDIKNQREEKKKYENPGDNEKGDRE